MAQGHKRRDAVIAAIARESLGIETLEQRFRDCLDFHEVGVISLREALERAYAAGQEAATKRDSTAAKRQ